jgi:hypothetical protein
MLKAVSNGMPDAAALNSMVRGAGLKKTAHGHTAMGGVIRV